LPQEAAPKTSKIEADATSKVSPARLASNVTDTIASLRKRYVREPVC